MNRPNKHPLPVNAPAGTTAAASGLSPLPDALTAHGLSAVEAGGQAYRYRTVEVVETTVARVSGEGFDADLVTHRTVEDASCAECAQILALNDLGLCERCHDANELPLQEFAAKHYPHLSIGMVR